MICICKTTKNASQLCMSKHYLYTFLTSTQQNDFGSAQNGRKMYTITNTGFITNDVMYLN